MSPGTMTAPESPPRKTAVASVELKPSVGLVSRMAFVTMRHQQRADLLLEEFEPRGIGFTRVAMSRTSTDQRDPGHGVQERTACPIAQEMSPPRRTFARGLSIVGKPSLEYSMRSLDWHLPCRKRGRFQAQSIHYFSKVALNPTATVSEVTVASFQDDGRSFDARPPQQ